MSSYQGRVFLVEGESLRKSLKEGTTGENKTVIRGRISYITTQLLDPKAITREKREEKLRSGPSI